MVLSLMANIKSMLSGNAHAKKLHPVFEDDADIPQAILCDSTFFAQIMMNLVANVIEFTPDGGKVTVQMRLLQKDNKRCPEPVFLALHPQNQGCFQESPHGRCNSTHLTCHHRHRLVLSP